MSIGMPSSSLNPPELTLGTKLQQINWGLILLLVLISSVGFAMLYSAANGSWTPWAVRQAIRFGIGLVITLGIALIDIRFLLRWAYLFYFITLGLLGVVEIAGEIGMGAQRWIDVGFFRLQPSELMKLALVLALARYFHHLTFEEVGRIRSLFAPLFLVFAPAILVLRQPDLGTAGMIILGGGAIFFLAGVRMWKFITVLVLGLSAIPVGWQFLHNYQKNRILTFINPENDPLGAGYHILQSKIALGSGGLFGKGFLQGSQSHLNFLPEKQTDFIFTMLAEEMGLAGAMFLLLLYVLALGYGFAIALRSSSQFGRLLALGTTTTLFLYVFINIAMVMGLIPVVGVPLPLISYGGTAMLTAMIGFGLIINCYVHKDVEIGRQGLDDHHR
ncbi:rod shape-determining protein RodA [Nisaea sediminum]|uniref:rod shape-determining protein RodA n=1 Tax=Nisaea sediminum TaxID=2775867 RepID=UPI001D032873|nr:rod shape-determining protein RodA [Nisaea sediminum]